MLAGVLLIAAVMLFNVPVRVRSAADPLSLTARPDISVFADANYVRPQLESAIRQTGIVKQAQVELAAPNLVLVTTPVAITLLGQPLQVDATTTMSVGVQNGRAVVSVEKIDASGVEVPRDFYLPVVEKLRVQGEDQLNRLVQSGLKGTGLRLANIRMAADGVTIDFSSH